jgi:predicted Zn-dependent peptidase
LHSPDIAVLRVIREIMTGSQSSRLYSLLRNQKGFIYSITSNVLAFSDSGTWVIQTSTNKQNVLELLYLLQQEISRLMQELVPSSELEIAQESLIKSKRLQLQTADQWVAFHVNTELLRPKDNWSIDSYIDEISSVTPNDIQAVAQKYFSTERWFLSLNGQIEREEIKFEFNAN